MAIVRGFIIGTGQEIQVELQTVRPPELTLFPDVQDNDRLVGWDESENTTRTMTIEMLRSKIIGDGTTQPPVLTNGTIQLVVDSTHANQYRWDLPSIAGQDFILQRRMVGDLLGGETMPEYEIISTGGFLLTGNSPKMREGEVFILKLVKLQGGDTEIIENSGGMFTGIVLVDSSISYNELHERKVIHFSGADNSIVYTLPSIEDVKENAILPFETHGQNQRQTTLQTVDNQLIYMNGGAYNSVYMRSGEIIWLQAGEDGWYVIAQYGNFNCVGEVEFGYKKKPNSLVMNGQLVLRSDHTRLWNEISTFGSSLVTEAQWQGTGDTDLTYKGCFSTGTVTSGPDANFRLPNVEGLFIRFTDTSSGRDPNARTLNAPGGYQPDAFKSHTHQFSNLDASDNASGSGFLMSSSSQSGLGRLYDQGQISNVGGDETRPKNIYLTGYVKS